MSLETVVEDIRDEAEQRAEEIREEAEAEANAIEQDAKEDAERIREEAETEVEAQIQREREQTRSSAQLEAKQERLRARRDLFDELRETVEDELASLADDRREELTRALLEDALTEFDRSAQLYGRADDESLLRSMTDEFDGLSYGGSTDCLGGVVVEGADSRVRINNTFDSVLEEIMEAERQSLSDLLFEE